MPPSQQNVIVVGMARSGTSMTADLFQRHGYFVAAEQAELRSGDKFNPSGYWEASRLLDANREVLRASGYTHDNTWMFPPIGESCAARVWTLDPLDGHRELIHLYEQNRPWVWKDPRLCFTLPYWWRLMDPSRTSVLLITRDEDEILRSFQRVGWRRDLDPKRLTICIRQHISAARNAITQLSIPHLEIDYSDFRHRPEQLAQELKIHFGFVCSSPDLGYHAKHNTSSLVGRWRWRGERLWMSVPELIRSVLKRLLRR